MWHMKVLADWLSGRKSAFNIYDVIKGRFNYLHLSIKWRFKQKYYYQR
jgi:hypothetical protein